MWRMLQSEAVQTRDTDLQEQTASRDSWPALTHIGRTRLNKSSEVKGKGSEGGSRGQKDTEKSKIGVLQKTLTTLKYKEGTVGSDTTKGKKKTKKNNNTRALYQFMNTTFV